MIKPELDHPILVLAVIKDMTYDFDSLRFLVENQGVYQLEYANLKKKFFNVNVIIKNV